ncbi:MAG TPA: SIS domain-containing protein, partial [Actinomycetota bacterium]|nr:SIS domain-containing protein [Actinomycetota bacterium]
MVSIMSRQVGWTQAAIALLEKLDQTQGAGLDHAAAICAEAIGSGGLVHLFGTGHSRMSV